MNGWTRPMTRLLKKWMANAEYESILHDRTIQYLQKLDLLKIFGIVCQGCSTFSSYLNVRDSCTEDKTVVIANAVLNTAATVLLSVWTYLDVQNRIAQHMSIKQDYEVFGVELDTMSKTAPENREPADVYVAKMKHKFINLKKSNNIIPDRIKNKYERNFERELKRVVETQDRLMEEEDNSTSEHFTQPVSPHRESIDTLERDLFPHRNQCLDTLERLPTVPPDTNV